MPNGIFPGATKVFNLYRRTTVVQSNGNRAAQTVLIATNISAVVNSNSGSIENDKGGLMFSGQYKGATFLDAPIYIGDTLQDINENEADGSPVKYQVQEKTLGAYAMSLKLQRSNPGV